MERGEEPGAAGAKRERREKRPRKLSARYLENAALYYLKRYAATVAQLRRVLVRKADRSVKFHGTDRAEALAWIEALLQKLQRSGLLDDSAYAGMKARSLRASGRSARMIGQKLRQKGVDQALTSRKLAEVTTEVSEEEAAHTWARKKRLGPYRREAATRADRRQRDLASLARAGFSFAIARKVIDGEAGYSHTSSTRSS